MKIINEFDVKVSNLVEDIYVCEFVSEDIALIAKPGQFVNVYLPFGEHILPRPISICFVEERNNNIILIYKEVGEGTKKIKYLNKLKIAAPLGNGFSINENYQRHIVVGGGIGIPPLLYLTSKLNGNVDVYLGAKSEPILIKKFEDLGACVYIASELNENFFKGTVIDLMNKNNAFANCIYACGPSAMLKAVADYASKRSIPAQLSMEERMACGLGACVGCAVRVKRSDISEALNKGWQYLKVCSDGPVFDSNEVLFDD